MLINNKEKQNKPIETNYSNKTLYNNPFNLMNM